ncbi:MAG: transglycosylase SLT domain-containing protein [Lonepinella koalarum]|nr:transglycosylase SLT domain-containing protein [Lonepinella koalarum]
MHFTVYFIAKRALTNEKITMMKTFFFRISKFYLLLLSLPVQADQLTEQRNTYQKINQILTISTNENSRILAKKLLAELQTYPLYPYAEYRLLNAEPELQSQQIQIVTEKYASLPFLTTLKKKWRKQLQQKQDWKTLLNQADLLPQDQASQCLLWQAKALTAETSEKITALFAENQNALTQLWLTGKSLPSECDAILSTWQQQTGFNDELLKQRALLSFEENNIPLLTHLQNISPEGSLKTWIGELKTLLDSPTELANPNHLFYGKKLTATEQDKRIFNSIIPQFIKTFQKADIIGYFNIIEDWANHIGLNKAENNTWKKAYITRFFDTEDTNIQEWRDLILYDLKDDQLTERRLRHAIRQKAKITPWLSQLSKEAQQKDEWQYWLAKVDTNKTHEILTALSSKRSFWGILAAQELNQMYQPEMQKLASTEQNITLESNVKAALARIAELRYFQDWSNLNSEWKALLESANFEQKLQLADYAHKQGWFELGVEATIQAKAWDYLSLRLPNAYQDWFDLHLKGKKIHRTFAMAIARQESAFRPNVSSSANARGLMQLLPTTAKQTAQKAKLPYKDDIQLFDPFDNIMLGTTHLQELYDKFGDNRILIAAAYNAGTHRVEQWLAKSQGKLNMAEFVSSIPFFETRGYVQNVLAYDVYYQILQKTPQQLFSKEEYNRLY